MNHKSRNATRLLFLSGALLAASPLWAMNSLSLLEAGSTSDGENVVLVGFEQPLGAVPGGFTLDAPPRIVLDFSGTANGMGKMRHALAGKNMSDAQIVESGNRTRLVINLDRMVAYNTALDGGNLMIALQESAPDIVAANDMPTGAKGSGMVNAEAEAEAQMLRFDISGYTLEGATLLSKQEIDAALAPFTGKNKDFSDVQRALEAVEDAYASQGYSAVRVLLPEQELEKGAIRFRVVESRFGKISVKESEFAGEENVLRALPSLRKGNVPRTRQISRELRLANENPARQLNVVMKAGEKDDEVDANVIVTGGKPVAWGASLDNTGSAETGRARLGLTWRHANLFDADHVGTLQFQTSPQHPDRVLVLGGGYKVPLYQSGNSMEFFAGYSDVNSVVGGLSNFQGGGLMFSARYHYLLEKSDEFDPRLSFGLDWRKFKRIEQTVAPTTVLYNEIVVMPLSVAYSVQGKFTRSEIGFNAALSANVPGMNNGKSGDFASYDQLNLTRPDSRYKILRVGTSYSTLAGAGWQLRSVLNGQWSPDTLVQGEQMRLGGADGVRGFTEGSEGGESGLRINLEAYTPDFDQNDIRARGVMFLDAGEIKDAAGGKSSIAGAGLGLRAGLGDQVALRFDMARIINEGSDSSQRKGDWRAHFSLTGTF